MSIVKYISYWLHLVKLMSHVQLGFTKLYYSSLNKLNLNTAVSKYKYQRTDSVTTIPFICFDIQKVVE